MNKNCLILAELKAFQNFLPVDKQAEFYEKLDILQEELKKQENSFSFNGKTVFLLVVTANFLLFPILNFIAKWISPNAPQIHFDLEKIMKMLLPVFGGF